MKSIRSNFSGRKIKVRNLTKSSSYHLVSNSSGCPSANFTLTWLSSDQHHLVVPNPWDNRTPTD